MKIVLIDSTKKTDDAVNLVYQNITASPKPLTNKNIRGMIDEWNRGTLHLFSLVQTMKALEESVPDVQLLANDQTLHDIRDFYRGYFNGLDISHSSVIAMIQEFNDEKKGHFWFGQYVKANFTSCAREPEITIVPTFQKENGRIVFFPPTTEVYAKLHNFRLSLHPAPTSKHPSSYLYIEDLIYNFNKEPHAPTGVPWFEKAITEFSKELTYTELLEYIATKTLDLKIEPTKKL